MTRTANVRYDGPQVFRSSLSLHHDRSYGFLVAHLLTSEGTSAVWVAELG